MKNLRNISIALILGIGILGTFSFSNEIKLPINNLEISESAQCRFSQCTATAKSTGQRCKHCVSNSGDTRCWQHK